MHTASNGRSKPLALSLLASERPRNVGWRQAAGLLFGDWGTSRLYVLGLALFFAGRTSFWLVLAMSLLILAVGWAYTQICRIYPDGGGVSTAAKHKSRMLAVVGALLLFADYTVTASLSALDAFHYYGLGAHHEQVVRGQTDDPPDAGAHLDAHRETPPSSADALFSYKSPALWAIVAIAAIGAFNLMGPKHTGGFALAAALGMIFITLLITAFALPQVRWAELPHRIPPLSETLKSSPGSLWVAFVSIVLALSGVEAIANLTGVMKKPVPVTARKAIWTVATEVAVFNVLLALFMVAIPVINRDKHLADMAAFLSGHYVGAWGELAVRVIGGTLLLSATNTALTDMISVQYLMARDGELPQFMVKLNRFGVPWLPAVVAASVPILVLLISHDLDSLAALYAIGVIGAVAINVSLCSIHPRLRKRWRKVAMVALGVVLLTIWVTLAFLKHEALIFVCVVMVVGLSARQLNRLWARRKGPRPTLLRQAVMEQLSPEVFGKPKIVIGTYGSDALAPVALLECKRSGSVLVVVFIRQINLSYKYEYTGRLTIDTDLAALRTFARYLELGHEHGVEVMPVYDTGPDAAEALAEAAAVHGAEKILIGTSRQGALYHFVKGHFQQRLEALLPPEIAVQPVTASQAELATEELRAIQSHQPPPSPPSPSLARTVEAAAQAQPTETAPPGA
jgi:amino acid transporter